MKKGIKIKRIIEGIKELIKKNKENLLILISALIFFIVMQLLFYFKVQWHLTILIPISYFVCFSYYYFKKFMNSWKKDPLEIIISYIFVMLILALVFSYFYLAFIGGNVGFFYNCSNTSRIMPEYYFSVSNIFSLSYPEPMCISGSLLKFFVGFEGILGNVITVVILGLIIGGYINKKEDERWNVINKYVFNQLYLEFQMFIYSFLANLRVEYNRPKLKKTIKRKGKEYLNPKYASELLKIVSNKLSGLSKEKISYFEKLITDINEKNIIKLKSILISFSDKITELLNRFPHNIPPELLSKIINVRENAFYLRNNMGLLDYINKIPDNKPIKSIIAKKLHEFILSLCSLNDDIKKEQNFFHFK